MTNLNNLAQEFQRLLENYTSDIGDKSRAVVQEVGTETAEELTQTSPKGNRKRKKYAKSWKVKRSRDHVIVHNTQYRLTHLLEKGHAKRGGGRTRAFPHIAPAEQRAINKVISEIQRAIQGT